jgi:hypothetical protein
MIKNELQTHIESLNAYCESLYGKQGFRTVSDPEHWAKYGVHTVQDFEKYQVASGVYDLHKEVHGFKPSWGELMKLSVEVLEAEYNSLMLEAEQLRAEEQIREQAAAVAARNQIQDLLDKGAENLEQALKWMHESYDTGGDDSFLDYELGTQYGFINSLRKHGL